MILCLIILSVNLTAWLHLQFAFIFPLWICLKHNKWFFFGGRELFKYLGDKSPYPIYSYGRFSFKGVEFTNHKGSCDGLTLPIILIENVLLYFNRYENMQILVVKSSCFSTLISCSNPLLFEQLSRWVFIF